MDAMRTDVTNYIKQLIKAAISKGRMPKTLYPLIKDKVGFCLVICYGFLSIGCCVLLHHMCKP